MARVIYVGPHEAVDVGGSGLIAERHGEPVEVDDELGAMLLASELWLEAGTSSSKPTKAELVARAEELGLDTAGTKADLEERIAEAETGGSEKDLEDDLEADDEAGAPAEEG